MMIELHMGDAINAFNLLKHEMVGVKVLHEELGAMGAVRVEMWSTKVGLSLEYHMSNGGCSLIINKPSK